MQGDEAAEKAGVEEVALVSHPATLGGCGGVDGVCKRVSKEWNRFVSNAYSIDKLYIKL